MSSRPAIALHAGLLAGLLAFAPGLLPAQDAPSPDMPRGKEWCQKNPGKCEEIRARRDKWCSDNPEQCERRKQKRAERQAWCRENPTECAAQREERRQKMQEMKARCDADPAACERRKQQMRDKHQKRNKDNPDQQQDKTTG